VVAGLCDKDGGLGGLGLGFSAGGLGAGKGRRHVKGEAGAFQREVCKVQPHLLASDVLHLGQVGANAFDQVCLASGSTAPPMSRSGDEGLGKVISAARLAKASNGGIERESSSQFAERLLCAADQQVGEADVVKAPPCPR
jgi:hypothetical protein